MDGSFRVFELIAKQRNRPNVGAALYHKLHLIRVVRAADGLRLAPVKVLLRSFAKHANISRSDIEFILLPVRSTRAVAS